MSISHGAASYSNHIAPLIIPPEVVDDIYLPYHCASILDAIDGNKVFKSSDWINGRSKLYPIAKIEDDYEEESDGQFQGNGRSEELKVNLSNREFRVCHEWRFHHKVNAGEMVLYKKEYDRFKKVLDEKIKRHLDILREKHGLFKIAASASPMNIGTNAGYSGINLGDQATPLHGKNPTVAEDLTYSIMTLLSENNVMCSANEIKMVVPPFFYEALVKSQRHLNICCSDENAQITGMIQLVSGIRVLKSNRLPYTVVGGKRIYKIIAVDSTRIGSPSRMLYLKWQDLGHDTTLFGDVIYDTHILDPLAVVVAHVSAED